MEISLHKIGEILQGKIIGDSSLKVSGVSSFKEAQKQHVTFADNNKFLKLIHLSKAGAIVVSKDYKGNYKNLIKVKNPRLAFVRLLKFFAPKKELNTSISLRSFIDKSAFLGVDTCIKPFVYIGKNVKIGDGSIINSGSVIENNVTIGNNVIIYPNVTIMEDCIIGNSVIINSGSVIGADGFGFIRDKNEGCYCKIPHIGIVQIDSEVEIGSCNTIDKATMGKTWIKSGVKTDNMVHIGHNVTIGENTLIISNTAIAGSTSIGRNVIIAGKVGIADHLNIESDVIIGPRSGIIKDVSKGEILSGSPAMPHNQWLRVQRELPNLPKMVKKIRKLEKRIKLLESEQVNQD